MRVPSSIFQVSRCAAALGALALLSLAGGLRAADPAADLESQYQTAIAILKKPPVTGILITEVQPESAAAAAGLRAGDILLEYYGIKVTTLQALSVQVAEAVARRIEDETAGKHVTARVRRGDEEKIFALPRDILGIRALEVEAGVPGPRNPPPNPRGSLVLDWKSLLQTLRTDSPTPDPADGATHGLGTPAVTAAFRLMLHSDPGADGTPPNRLPRAEEDWIGWELCTLAPEGDDGLSGTIDMYHLMPAVRPPDDNTVPTEHSVFTFHLRLGDYKTTPAFVLDQTSARYAAPAGQENMQFVTQAQRLGERLQTTSGLALPDGALGDNGRRTEQHENATPLSAAPQAALPWIAAALPQEDGDALALYLLSVRDLLPRPGYVLATRGRAPLPPDPVGVTAPSLTLAPATPPPPTAAPAPSTTPAPDPWRVDLVHCGIVIESYWFTDQRRLLCIQTQGPQSVVARRAENAKSAALPMEKKPAAAPSAPSTNP